MPKEVVIDDKWIRTIEDKYTFCGIFELFFDEICDQKHWKAQSTKDQYIRDCNKRLLPALNDQDNKTIDQYTKSDFDDALEIVKTSGKTSILSELTLQRYRRLIEGVVSCAAEHNLCENVLWGSSFTIDIETPAENKIKELVKLKKSLTPKQEMAVYERIMGDVKQPGTRFGVLLMFALGLRNGEACATNFDDIQTMPEANNLHVLRIYKTVESREGKLVSSGKTKNADRLIPIPQEVYEFLEQRKKYICEVENMDEAQVNALPIACDKNEYTKRCVPDTMSSAGKNVFKEIGVEGEVLAYIDSQIENGEDPVLIKEKDPTSYLFRRNFATHLHIVGCTEPEIEYLMGHDIEDAYETRNEFINAQRLEIIKQKMDQRAVFYLGSCMPVEFCALNQSTLNKKITEDADITFNAFPGIIQIQVETNEPNEKLVVKTKTLKEEPKNQQCVLISKREGSYDVGRTIDALKQYHLVYKRL